MAKASICAVRGPLPKRKQGLPDRPSRAEVAALLAACGNAKHRAVLATGYGCGLRISEVVAIRIPHIDRERCLLRVERGEGGKDRPLSRGELARVIARLLARRG